MENNITHILKQAMENAMLKEKLKAQSKFIKDNNLSDDDTLKNSDVPKDKNGFIDFNAIFEE